MGVCSSARYLSFIEVHCPSSASFGLLKLLNSMFLLGSHRCFIPNGPLLSSMTRLFSTSSTPQAGYKMKSHSGTKKRWRSLGSGDAFKRVECCLSRGGIVTGWNGIMAEVKPPV
ncbi:hypothetical protein EYR40_009415 [Pleurotus pulmonarius]|nr:hypothetical protein EYR40_009415 [Pleurotus pulmonarius]